MADKGKIKGRIATNYEGHNEVERKGKSREECGKYAYVEAFFHRPALWSSKHRYILGCCPVDDLPDWKSALSNRAFARALDLPNIASD
jgi:hypothetical protein